MKKLQDVCTIKTGKMDANHATPNGNYRFYTCASHYSYCDTYSFSGPCVIVPGNGDIGLVFYYDGNFEAYQRTYVLCDICIYPKYLYYHMLYMWRNINSGKQYGSTVRYVRMSNFTNYELPVPELSVQKTIVTQIEESLSQLDSAVETLKKTKQQLEVYRQAVLMEAFSGRLTQTWRKNHPQNTIQVLIKKIQDRKNCVALGDTDLSDYEIKLSALPNNWKWIIIGNITSGTEYGTSKKSAKDGEMPVVRMGNIKNGLIDWTDLVFSNDKQDNEHYLLHEGDVLFNRTNSPELVGKTAIYHGERPAIYAGYLIRINQYDFINPEYLNYYMNSATAKSYGSKVKTDGVNQSNINSKKLCSYPFPVCSEAEQEQVVIELKSRLSMCDNIEKTVEQSLQQAETLRQSILKQAFSLYYRRKNDLFY